MKRYVATMTVIVMAVLLLVPAISLADYWIVPYQRTYTNWNGVVIGHISELVLKYNRNGDLTEDEITELTMCVAESELCSAVFLTGSGVNGDIKDDLITGSVDFATMILGAYGRYRNGEVERDPFLRVLISMANIIVNSN